MNTGHAPVDPDCPVSHSDDEPRIERQIEALKSFLARYPPATSGTRAADAADVATEAPRPPHALESTLADPPTPFFSTRVGQIAAGVAVFALVVIAALVGNPDRSAAGRTPIGTLSVSTNPSGLTVTIDGTAHHVTPVTVDLVPGDHILELVTAAETRRVPVTIVAGGQVSHFFELAPVALQLTQTPPSPPVPAPAVVATAGAPESNAAGWIAIKAPSDVQVLENGRLLGSSSIERIMLPVGRHQLEFVNDSLGYRAVQTVHVIAGDVVPIDLRWPQGSVALNAIPWAEVWVDGRHVGETPIGSLSLPIGAHEVVFRHPELGERRATLTVAVGKTATLGVDFGAK